jgi:hypothetical protein
VRSFPSRLLVPLAVCALLAATAGATSGSARSPAASGACRVLTTPRSLAATLLRLHRVYMRHRPDVHHPTITGPVGRVDLGACGATRYAEATFDARYNGVYFGAEDQPERFVRRGGGWRDIGNTGGDPCGSAPTALLVGWRIVRRCPD